MKVKIVKNDSSFPAGFAKWIFNIYDESGDAWLHGGESFTKRDRDAALQAIMAEHGYTEDE